MPPNLEQFFPMDNVIHILYCETQIKYSRLQSIYDIFRIILCQKFPNLNKKYHIVRKKN